jgi:type IV pilus assembly protein PilB
VEPDGKQVIDVRCSFYVSIHGEKVCLRILNRKATLLNIEEIGMAPAVLERFKYEALDVPSGVVLITGPTGSGKTTTLYGCVDYLNNDDTCIITAEEPVEYVIDGITQCSLNPKIDMTFAETLRHIVRQDPDVIVLGEIRDKESAEAAIQSALTDHKVLSTFHTEDTIGGLLRLMNMNIETFLISSTVVSVLAQRLLRRVCPNCARPYRPTPLETQRIGLHADDLRLSTFQVGSGCEACHYTGYRGRVSVFELLVLDERVKDAILMRKASYDIRRISIECSGLITLLEDGLEKASRGLTTLAEVMRVLPRAEKPRPLAEIKRLCRSSTDG